MKIFVITTFLVISYFNSLSQFRSSYWCFGDSAAINFEVPTNPIVLSSAVNARGVSCSIADSTGNLLFYSCIPNLIWWDSGYGDVGVVYNTQNNVMQNGDTLKGTQWFQNMILIPYPGYTDSFFVFVNGITSGYRGLYYSIVDMTLNSGLGAVVSRDTKLLDSILVDDLIAIKHGNGRDWWVITHPGYIHPTNLFYLYLVTPDGVQTPIQQNIGGYGSTTLGKSAVYSGGSKIVFVNYRGLIQTLEFDRCNGIFFNPHIITTETTPIPLYWDVEISPNGEVLYVSTEYNGPNNDVSYLLQYDLTAPNIAATKDTIATFHLPAMAGALKLAPDEKIYLSCYYQPIGVPYYPYPDSCRNYINENLSVIQNPDVLGVGCNFTPFSFYLGGKRTYTGLPNNPNYEMPAWGGSVCDTLGLPNNILNSELVKEKLNVTYNYMQDIAIIEYRNIIESGYSLIIYDLMGKILYKSVFKGLSNYSFHEINFKAHSPGLYFVMLKSEKEILLGRFIK